MMRQYVSIPQKFADSQIKDSLETVYNPFESNESVFMHTESRREQRKIREKSHRKGVHRYTSKSFQYNEQEDLDIAEEIREHGDNVHIIK